MQLDSGKAQSSNDLPREENSFSDFTAWLSQLTEALRPDIVVSIARGALRLLQLQHAEHVISPARFYSNHAIPFLPDNEIASKRILLIDDSVIFGSTMSRVSHYLVARGAMVYCAAYIADRTHFYGEQSPHAVTSPRASKHSSLPLYVRHRLWPREVRIHHARLVRSVLQSPLSYNPDFPTFRIDTDKFIPGDVPYVAQSLRRARGVRSLVDVSAPVSALAQVYRFTAMFAHTSWDLFSNPNIKCRPHSKARVTFVPPIGQILVTPIVQLTADVPLGFGNIQFVNPLLSDLWESLSPPPAKDDTFFASSVFRLLTAFVSIVIGHELIARIVNAVPAELNLSGCTLVPEDLGATFGPQNHSRLLCVLKTLEVNSFSKESSFYEPSAIAQEEPSCPELQQAVVAICRQNAALRPNAGEEVWESVGKLLLALRLATDSEEVRQKKS